MNQLEQNQPDCGKIKEIWDFLSTDPYKAEKNSARKKSGKADGCMVYFILQICSVNILYFRVLSEYGVFFMAC